MKKFPKVLYIAREEEKDNTYFVPEEDYQSHAEICDDVIVGVYRLERVAKVTTKAELK